MTETEVKEELFKLFINSDTMFGRAITMDEKEGYIISKYDFADFVKNLSSENFTHYRKNQKKEDSKISSTLVHA